MATGLVRDMALASNFTSSSAASLARSSEFLSSISARLDALEDANSGEDLGTNTVQRSLAQVVELATQVVHLVPFGPAGLARETLCGWVFPDEEAELLNNLNPHHRECDRCFQSNLSESE